MLGKMTACGCILFATRTALRIEGRGIRRRGPAARGAQAFAARLAAKTVRIVVLSHRAEPPTLWVAWYRKG